MPATTYRAADFVEAAIRLGTEVVVGCDERQTLEDAAPGGTLRVELRRPEVSLERILASHRERPFSAIVGVEDDAVLLAALASEALGLPHNPPDAVRASRDKHRMRELLHSAGLPVPAYRKIPLDAEPESAAREAAYPCVLKPLFLSASRGVIRANDPASFVAAFRRLRDLLSQPEVEEKGGDAARWILAESYIPGIEVALEGLLVAGRLKVLALFDKPDPLEGPFFEETIYVTPSRLPAGTQAEIERCAAGSASALGLREGPIHAEFRVGDRGVRPLEVAARSIGGLCSRTLRFGAGISLEELILRHAMGTGVEELAREPRPAGVMMIPIPGEGILHRFDGIESARAVPGIEDVVRSVPLGERVVPLPEGSRYLGFLFARGESPEAVERSLREAHRRLGIEIQTTRSTRRRGSN
jgi:biotin carboxylase